MGIGNGADAAQTVIGGIHQVIACRIVQRGLSGAAECVEGGVILNPVGSIKLLFAGDGERIRKEESVSGFWPELSAGDLAMVMRQRSS